MPFSTLHGNIFQIFCSFVDGGVGFWGRVSPCNSPGYPGIHFIVQAVLELIDLPASASLGVHHHHPALLFIFEQDVCLLNFEM